MTNISQSKAAGFFKRYAFWILLLIVLGSIVPFMPDDLVVVFIFANVFALWAMSWDLIAGVTGYVNFGHGVIFGLAGYFSFLFAGAYYKGMTISPLVLPTQIAALIGIIAGTLVALVFFLPSLRLRGMYFTLATLLILFIVDRFIIYFREIFGGTLGLWGAPEIVSGLIPDFYLTLIPVAVLGAILYREFKERLGVVFRSIREDEDLLSNIGMNPNKFKFYMFVWASFTAAVGGVLISHHMGAIAPATFFSLEPLLIIILMTFVGGYGTIWGPVMGAYIIRIIIWIITPYHLGALRFLIFAVIALLFIYFLPRGLGPTILDKVKKLR